MRFLSGRKHGDPLASPRFSLGLAPVSEHKSCMQISSAGAGPPGQEVVSFLEKIHGRRQRCVRSEFSLLTCLLLALIGMLTRAQAAAPVFIDTGILFGEVPTGACTWADFDTDGEHDLLLTRQ